VVRPDVPPSYPYGNCIYVNDEQPAVLDLGAGKRAFSAIPCQEIQVCLISHVHFDHTHGDCFFPRARFYVGWQEERMYRDEEFFMRFHGYNMWEDLMPGVPLRPYEESVSLPADDVLNKPGYRPIMIAGTFADQQIIDLGRTRVQVLHLPGHTGGHYGFYLPDDNILFSGDIDLASMGPWYFSDSADIGDLLQSIQRIKEINPRILVPSHRRVIFEGIPEKLDRYRQVVLDREARIMELLDRPRTIDDLAQYGLTFPERRNEFELFWEKMTMRNHLRYLIKQGKVREGDDGYYYRVDER
jgi:glyoxylase-like metal-dependent hydrolase (beta-lactamase superfamily II)